MRAMTYAFLMAFALLALLAPNRLIADEQGILGVLIDDQKVPIKVLARSDGLKMTSVKDASPQPFRHLVPYFVFADVDDKYLIHQIQDKEKADEDGGWVKKADCHLWRSRRLAYPKVDGEIVRRFSQAFGLDGALPAFDAAERMPWPLVHVNKDDPKETLLCVLEDIGAGTVSIRPNRLDDFDIYVLYSDTELAKATSRLLNVIALIDSGKKPDKAVVEAWEGLITQSQIDFLDLSHLRKVVELFPGGAGKVDLLLERQLKNEMKALRDSFDTQVKELTRLRSSSGCYNDKHLLYVFPLTSLSVK